MVEGYSKVEREGGDDAEENADADDNAGEGVEDFGSPKSEKEKPSLEGEEFSPVFEEITAQAKNCSFAR